MDTLALRLAAVRERIAAAARASSRAPEEIRLVGVTKTHSAEVIAQAVATGLNDLGENRVQEAEPKIAALAAERAGISWHLIGHLQRNKARRAARLFDMIHSVDSLQLAETLNRHATEDREWKIEDRGSHPRSSILYPPSSILYPRRLPILLQVNVSGEATKEGFELLRWEERPDLLGPFLADVERMLALPQIAIRGLMTIAPWGSDPEAARPTFRSARRLRDELARRFPQGDWGTLSMGMTDDFEVAIAEGSTLVRVGRAIFGERVSKVKS